MNAMTMSRWDTGTYELLIHPDAQGGPGDLMVVIFARPTVAEDTASDEDAPILAHIDVANDEYDWELQKYHLGMRSIGERGMFIPEDIPRVYGDMLGSVILKALCQAAERDSRGVDMDAVPWRTPSPQAKVIMDRALEVLRVVQERLRP